ncbi:MAG: type I-C CRISPR-associated endonuclease Cas1c [Verrucomicrobiota bacterium]
MKRHLNTLFITLEGAWLAKDGATVDVRFEKQSRLRVPLHNLDGIVTFGWDIGMSPQLMQACAETGVSISFCSPHGKFIAAATGFSPGNVLLRRAQYRIADDLPAAVLVAREMIGAKIANSRTVLLRAARDHARETLETVCRRLACRAQDARACTDLDSLRGIEGDAAESYLSSLNLCLTNPDPAWRMAGRSRRPPLDRLNCLLSFLYAMLAHDCRSALEACGLDAAVGFLHRDRPGRPGMALDLMEEFRPMLADRLALSLINRCQLQPRDFTVEEGGAVSLKDDARKAVLIAWQERKQEEITHPFLGEKTTIGLLVHLQARLLARHLRGDTDAYPPFLWR